MKYLLFAGDDYYPAGGMDDFRGVFDSVQLAKEHQETNGWNWAHVAMLDETGLRVVERYEYMKHADESTAAWRSE